MDPAAVPEWSCGSHPQPHVRPSGHWEEDTACPPACQARERWPQLPTSPSLRSRGFGDLPKAHSLAPVQGRRAFCKHRLRTRPSDSVAGRQPHLTPEAPPSAPQSPAFTLPSSMRSLVPWSCLPSPGDVLAIQTYLPGLRLDPVPPPPPPPHSLLCPFLSVCSVPAALPVPVGLERRSPSRTWPGTRHAGASQPAVSCLTGRAESRGCCQLQLKGAAPRAGRDLGPPQATCNGCFPGTACSLHPRSTGGSS